MKEHFNHFTQLKPEYLSARNDDLDETETHRTSTPTSLDPEGLAKTSELLRKRFQDFTQKVAELSEKFVEYHYIGHRSEFKEWLAAGQHSDDLLADLETQSNLPPAEQDGELVAIWFSELRKRIQNGSLEPSRKPTP